MINQEGVRLHGWIKARPFVEKNGRDTHSSSHADWRRHAIAENGEGRDAHAAHAAHAVGTRAVQGRAEGAVANRGHIDMII